MGECDHGSDTLYNCNVFLKPDTTLDIYLIDTAVQNVLYANRDFKSLKVFLLDNVLSLDFMFKMYYTGCKMSPDEPGCIKNS